MKDIHCIVSFKSNKYEIAEWEQYDDIYTLVSYKKEPLAGKDLDFSQVLSTDLKSKKIYLLFSDKKTLFYAETLAWASEKQLSSYIKDKLAHQYNLDLFFYRLLMRPVIRGKLAEVIIAGIEYEILDKILPFHSKDNFNIEDITILPLAILNIIENSQLGKEGNSLFLYLDDEQGLLFLTRDGYFVRYLELPFGLNRAYTCLQRSVYTEEGVKELTLPDSEELITSLGYPLGDGNYNGISYQQLRLLLSPFLELIKDEILKVISSFRHRNPGEDIKRICLLGKVVLFKNLASYIESKTEVKTLEVSASSLFSNFLIGKEITISLDSSLPFIAPLHKNRWKQILFPPQFRLQEKMRSLRRIILVSFITIITFVLFFYTLLQTVYIYYSHLRKNVSKTLSKIQVDSEKISQIEKYRKRLDKIVLQLNELYAQEPDWIGIMKELSYITPQEIILDNLEKRQDSLIIYGHIYSAPGFYDLIVSRYIENLLASKYFHDVKLKARKTMQSPLAGLYFELQCLIK